MGDEELTAVGAGSGIGHGEETATVVLETGSELVGEFVTGPPHAAACRITALDHEIRNDAVEGDSIVESAAGEIQIVRYGNRGLAGIHGRMDVSLGCVEGNADVLDGFGGVCGSGDTGGHAKSGGKGEKCLFHWNAIG